MITPKTQAAIAVLNDIYAGGDTARTDACRLTEQDMDTLLSKLSSAGLIKLSGKGCLPSIGLQDTNHHDRKHS